MSHAANKTKLHRQLSQDDGRTRRSSMAMTGKQQLLPLSSSMHGRVSELAWHLPVEPPNNLVRMRNQSLGQSAPSLTAGLVRGATHNWPSVARVREGLVGRATPVVGWAQCTLTKVARCTVFPQAHWCGWLPGWMCAVLKKQRLGWLCIGGRMTFNLRLSRARTGVVAMRQQYHTKMVNGSWV
ncbi:unnamed protein product [Oncorhynchus mykiss]|uniref:Uncharacterized protein n=1 Tax=Oncorhynchus mykiss TaxID=8022 RepID=A0A060WE88_ONCMY|nr:unnamed protein product [Oncorhynchus mykiss]